MPRSLVHVPFAGGLDERTAPEHLPAPQLLQATNCRMHKTGRLDKRPGNVRRTTTIGGATMSSSSGCALFSYGTETLVIGSVAGDFKLASYSPNQSSLVYKDRVPEPQITRTSVSHFTQGVYTPDYASSGTLRAVVWCDASPGTPGHVYVTVEDTTSGTEYYSSYRLTTTLSLAPRVCIIAGAVVVTYAQLSNVIYGRALASPTGAWGTETLLVTGSDNTLGSQYEISAYGSVFALVYPAVTTFRINARTYNNALVQQSTGTTTDTTGSARFAFGLRGTVGETLWITYVGNDSGAVQRLWASGLNPSTLAETVAPFVLATPSLTVASTAVERISSTDAAVVYTEGTPYGARTVGMRVTTSRSITIDSTRRFAYWCSLASKPFVVNGKVWVWVYAGNAAVVPQTVRQYSMVLVDTGLDQTGVSQVVLLRPVGITMPRFAANEIVQYPPSVGDQTDTIGKVLRSAAGRIGLVRVLADYTAQGRWQASTLGETVHLAGGLASAWDGSGLVEEGFIHHPASGQLTAVVGGSMPLGVYYIRLVYEWVDSKGQIHRSAPSVAQSVTLSGAANQIQIVAPTISLTRKECQDNGYSRPISLTVYITDTDPVVPIGGTSLDLTYYQVDNGQDAIGVSGETITMLVNAQPSAYKSNAQIYTAGGVLDNVCPPSLLGLVAHRGRLWGIADDARTLYFTKQFVDGEAPAFCDEFTVPFDDGATLTAVASMDEKLVIFSTTRIYVLSGDGPNDQGGQNDYQSPSRVSSDVGCVFPSSVVLTPVGLAFASRVGIYLCDRTLSVTYIGQPVYDEVATWQTFVGSSLHPTQPWIYWSITNGSTGRRLVYDYRVSKWFVDAFVGLFTTVSTGGAFVDSTGAYWEESSSTWLDNGAWVTLSAKLAWTASAGLQGRQYIQRTTVLAIRNSDHDLGATFYRDYASVGVQTSLLTATEINSLAQEQLQVHNTPIECSAWTVQIADGTPTGGTVGTGQGPTLIGVTFELEPREGAVVLPAVNRR